MDAKYLDNSYNVPLWLFPNNSREGAYLELNEDLFKALIESNQIINYFVVPGVLKDELDKEFGFYDPNSKKLVNSNSDYKPNKGDSFFHPQQIAKSFVLNESRLIKAMNECAVKSINIKGVIFFSLIEFHTKNVLEKYDELKN